MITLYVHVNLDSSCSAVRKLIFLLLNLIAAFLLVFEKQNIYIKLNYKSKVQHFKIDSH